jgi:hypothetical protein
MGIKNNISELRYLLEKIEKMMELQSDLIEEDSNEENHLFGDCLRFLKPRFEERGSLSEIQSLVDSLSWNLYSEESRTPENSNGNKEKTSTTFVSNEIKPTRFLPDNPVEGSWKFVPFNFHFEKTELADRYGYSLNLVDETIGEEVPREFPPHHLEHYDKRVKDLIFAEYRKNNVDEIITNSGIKDVDEYNEVSKGILLPRYRAFIKRPAYNDQETSCNLRKALESALIAVTLFDAPDGSNRLRVIDSAEFVKNLTQLASPLSDKIGASSSNLRRVLNHLLLGSNFLIDAINPPIKSGLRSRKLLICNAKLYRGIPSLFSGSSLEEDPILWVFLNALTYYISDPYTRFALIFMLYDALRDDAPFDRSSIREWMGLDEETGEAVFQAANTEAVNCGILTTSAKEQNEVSNCISEKLYGLKDYLYL